MMRRAIVYLFLPLAACGGSSTSGGHGASSVSASDGENVLPAYPSSQSQTVTCKGLVPVTEGLRNKAFYALSGTEWKTLSCSYSYAYDGCVTVRLEPDGHYSIATAFSGSNPAPNGPVLRQDAGSWNFASSGGQSGVVCLDGAIASSATATGESNLPSALAFEVKGGQLTLGSMTLQQGDTITTPGTAANLPDVHVPEGFARLVGKTWRKASTFDPLTVPSSLAFDALGRLTEAFQAPSCNSTGPMSWDKDTMLFAPSSCDYSYSSVVAQVPDFIDDLFVFSNSVFRASASANARSEFVFDPYGHAIHVRGSFDGALHAGVPTTIGLTLTNVDPVLVRQLNTLIVTIQPAKLSYGTQYTTAGVAPTTLVTRDYASLALAAGQSHEDSVTITPPSAGDTFALSFEIAFRDATKDYNGTHTYITAVLP